MATIASLWPKSTAFLPYGKTTALYIIYLNLNLQRVTSWCQFDMHYCAWILTSALQAIITEHTQTAFLHVRCTHPLECHRWPLYTHSAAHICGHKQTHTKQSAVSLIYLISVNVWRLGVFVALQRDKSPGGVMKNRASAQKYVQRKWHNCGGLKMLRKKHSDWRERQRCGNYSKRLIK